MGSWRRWISRWFIPISFFGLMAPFFLGRGRWRSSDAARALARVDKTLRLDERALTAWELLERNETRAAALMVLKQAGRNSQTSILRRCFAEVGAGKPIALFRFFSFGSDFYGLTSVFDSTAICSSQLRRAWRRSCESFLENSRRRRRTRGLHESFRMGRELEQVAQKGIDAKTGDEKFKADLAGMQNKIATMGKSAAEQQSLSAAESQQDLRDLKAELEAARDLLNIADAAKGAQELEQTVARSIGDVAPTQKQFEREGQAGQSL